MEKNDKDLPRVAIIVPCFNHGHYAQRCLDSIAEQDYKKKMIVIVDDKSTDDSLDIIQEIINAKFDNKPCDGFIGEYKGIPVYLLINEENLKQSKTRNKAIKFIWDKTDLFAVLDMDDLYLPGKLSKGVYKWMEASEAIGLVYNDVLIRDERNDRVVYEAREPFTRIRIEQECMIANSPLINKKAFEVAGLYDEELTPCEDWDLWIRITERMVAVHIPEALQIYSVTGLNCSFTTPKESWQDNWRKVYEKMMSRKNASHNIH
jgi:glycosyltransferase involved in cell wall biosynthesis